MRSANRKTAPIERHESECSTRHRQDGPYAVAARYDRRRGRIVVSLSTGLEVAFAPRMAQGLEAAGPAELASIEISPSGFGLHFPKLDADLYLPALLHGFMGSRGWRAAQLGRQGRRPQAEGKLSGGSRNGKLGGRSRKAAS